MAGMLAERKGLAGAGFPGGRHPIPILGSQRSIQALKPRRVGFERGDGFADVKGVQASLHDLADPAVKFYP